MRDIPRWGSDGPRLDTVDGALDGARLDTVDGAVSLEDQMATLAAEVEGLRRALETRPLIDLAKGMVMHRYSCGDSAAFGLLRRFSQEHNVKIRDLAAAIVARVDGDQDGEEVSPQVVSIANQLFEAGTTEEMGP